MPIDPERFMSVNTTNHVHLMMVLWAVGCLSLCAGGCETRTTDADLDAIRITLAEIRAEQARGAHRVLMIDGRRPDEYRQERIAGAIFRSLTDVSGRGADIDPRINAARLKVVYGNDPSTATARALAKRMLAAGYSGVRYFENGFLEWKRANLPTESGDPAPP
jgi:rhodanese-related sulfurtransferase